MGEQYSLQLIEILAKIETQLYAIPVSEMNYKPSADKWSKKEILGHLIDSAYNNHQRLIRVESMSDLIFDGYNQEDWVIKNNYQGRDEKEIIRLFISANRHLAHLMVSLKDEVILASTQSHNFDKICMRPLQIGKSTSLSYLIEDYIFHLEHHLSQIIDQ